MDTTSTTSTTPARYRRELRMIEHDLRTTGRSTAADRQARLEHQDAERLARQQERRAAIVAIRERYWAARGRRTRSRR